MADINNDSKQKLRAEDIVPPYDCQSQEGDIKNPATNNENKTNKSPRLPGFDLAEAIMADHRKLTAAKRIGPAQRNVIKHNQNIKSGPKRGPIGYAIEQSLRELSAQQMAVSEIVARDIEQLLNSSSHT